MRCKSKQNTIKPLGGRWRERQTKIQKLSHFQEASSGLPKKTDQSTLQQIASQKMGDAILREEEGEREKGREEEEGVEKVNTVLFCCCCLFVDNVAIFRCFPIYVKY